MFMLEANVVMLNTRFRMAHSSLLDFEASDDAPADNEFPFHMIGADIANRKVESEPENIYC